MMYFYMIWKLNLQKELPMPFENNTQKRWEFQLMGSMLIILILLLLLLKKNMVTEVSHLYMLQVLNNVTMEMIIQTMVVLLNVQLFYYHKLNQNIKKLSYH